MIEEINQFVSRFPDEARVWIYQSSRGLTDDEAVNLENNIKGFLGNWKAHDQSLNADGFVFKNRFVLIIVNEEGVKASGCSIDSMVRFVKECGKNLGIDFFDRLLVYYVPVSGNIKSFNFHQLFELLNSGELTLKTLVFDNMVANVGELKSKWLVELDKSWIAPFVKAGV